MTPLLRGTDLFCGGGGFTTGAIASGYVDMRLAVNHWRTAIYTHQSNHPGVRHICARIDDIDPRHDDSLPPCDLLLASPECTHHSIARGGRPIHDQKRATPWHVCVWAEAKRPKWIVIENVREFRDWGPLDARGRPQKSRKGETFRAWVRSIESLGYQVDHQLLNAADFGAATSRTRLFIAARRGRSRKDIPWPEPTHPKGAWRSAHEIIDWSIPCPSIFGRKRPLAEKTLRRIETGLLKFVGGSADPFIVTLRRNMAGRDIRDPLATITAASQHHSLCVPFQLKAMGRCAGLTRGIDQPLPTIVASRENHAVVAPYFLPRQGVYDCRRDKPAASIEQPVNTITANYGTGVAAGIDCPVDTITARDRFALCRASLAWTEHFPSLRLLLGTGRSPAAMSLIATMFELGVIDIGYRMLTPAELALAQGFPLGYYLHGTFADQVRQVGNSVSPPVAQAICTTLAEAA